MNVNVFQQSKSDEIFINKFKDRHSGIAKSKDFYGNIHNYEVSDEMFLSIWSVKKSSWSEMYDEVKKDMNTSKYRNGESYKL